MGSVALMRSGEMTMLSRLMPTILVVLMPTSIPITIPIVCVVAFVLDLDGEISVVDKP